MNSINTSLLRNPVVLLIIGAVLGLALGIFYGWYVNPVVWSNVQADQLGDEFKDYYLQSVTRDWAASTDPKRDSVAYARLGNHADALLAFVNSDASKLPADQKPAVVAMLTAVKAQQVAAGGGTAPAGNNFLTTAMLCLLGIAIIALVGAGGWYVASRRQPATVASMMAGRAGAGSGAVAPTADWGMTTAPVAQFTSKYIGTDVGYDDSFSIDTAAGDFLGECGVGVSETIGVGDPKKITALEVWLFDKNDIRTVTKVLMSEHAYYDDALRAKLAPKGEAILARVGETVILETAALQVSARVVELEYGSAAGLPPTSYFSKITIELAAWSKEAAPAPAQAA